MTLLNDCEHFVREFFTVLSTSSQQVYHSALMFTPSETLFWERYGNKLPEIRVQNGCQKKWNCGQWTVILVVLTQLHSPQMAHILCQDLMTGHFDCGMQSVVLISTLSISGTAR
jgi:hypothetical protein